MQIRKGSVRLSFFFLFWDFHLFLALSTRDEGSRPQGTEGKWSIFGVSIMRLRTLGPITKPKVSSHGIPYREEVARTLLYLQLECWICSTLKWMKLMEQWAFICFSIDLLLTYEAVGKLILSRDHSILISSLVNDIQLALAAIFNGTAFKRWVKLYEY